MTIFKNRKFKLTEKKYDYASSVLIPFILSVSIEVLKGLYNFTSNAAGKNGCILEEEFPQMKVVLIPALIVLFFVLFYILLHFNNWLKNLLFDSPQEEKYMKDTFLRLKEFGSKRQDCFNNEINFLISNPEYLEFLIITHKKSIDLVVSTCLEFFNDSFSAQGNLVNEISFEVSFMSKSFIDDKITIVSADNSKHRTPPSMLERNSKPNIYDNTETGKLYERYSSKPSATLAIHIVEDCSCENEFASLYEGEINTIKSMAVLPILSPQNELLGTLVVCANQSNFFKNQERHFWNELLEIYSVELGYHYLALKYCIERNKNSLSDLFKKPF